MDRKTSDMDKPAGTCCGGCKNAANGSCKSLRVDFGFDADEAGPSATAAAAATRAQDGASAALR